MGMQSTRGSRLRLPSVLCLIAAPTCVQPWAIASRRVTLGSKSSCHGRASFSSYGCRDDRSFTRLYARRRGRPSKSDTVGQIGAGERKTEEQIFPANETHASASFDANNPFFTVDYGEREMEEEMMVELDRDDPDAYTEVFSTAEERQRKADSTRNRYDFTCLTVEQVARSYQVPISWLGEALCNFGVSPPVQWNARIGDLIDGESAFALLEAMHGWDHAVMYDMYTWDSLRTVAINNDLELSDVLRVCDEEGFALPFGFRTRLRYAQYARLMRRLGLQDRLSDQIRENFPDPDWPT